ncbi:MAG: protein translocase subunit SecD [Chlamydiota bacterium]
MEKQKRWQLYLIIAVIALTIYNILPTIIYYAQPLNKPIDEQRSKKISQQIVKRVNNLEEEAQEWLGAFCKNLGFKADSIKLSEQDPGLLRVKLKNEHDAKIFKSYLSKAGELIPFVPAQLDLASDQPAPESLEVLVSRRIGVHLDSQDLDDYFSFSFKETPQDQIAPLYRKVIDDRAATVVAAVAGVSDNGQLVEGALNAADDQLVMQNIMEIADNIVDFSNSFDTKHPISKRYYASFSQMATKDKKGAIEDLTRKMEYVKTEIDNRLQEIKDEQSQLQKEGRYLDPRRAQSLEIYHSQQATLTKALNILKGNKAFFSEGSSPLTSSQIMSALAEQSSQVMRHSINIGKNNTFFREIAVDWDNDKIIFIPHRDIEDLRSQTATTEQEAYYQNQINKLMIKEVADLSRQLDENITPSGEYYAIHLNNLTGSTSFLTMNLPAIAEQKVQQVYNSIIASWHPEHPDLKRQVYPIWNYEAYQELTPVEKQFGLLIAAPVTEDQHSQQLNPGSIYVIAKGLEAVIQKYQQFPESPEARQFEADINNLKSILQGEGFTVDFPGTILGQQSEYANSYIFEQSNYYDNLLKSTRENFSVHGNKRYAVLEFTDVEQRLRVRNNIADSIHEDLVKWRDEYNSAQVSLDPQAKYFVPPPTTNVIWDNVKLSIKKFFRGDQRKILKWGLDLSGGKTVVIGLKDQNNRTVTNPEDVKLAMNELTQRVNKMGVSEVSIRSEGANIVMDFPGSQGLSANELVQAAAMYFHIVNEKFTPQNEALSQHVNKFLMNVWNEAVVTNRTDIESINEIAWKHLGGESDSHEINPRSETARVLYESGLKLAPPSDTSRTNAYNDTISAIARYRGDNLNDWRGQSHPLIVVFNNYALEGSLLDNVRTAYDPGEGNILVFDVQSSYGSKEKQGNPRNDFYVWTSQFAQDRIAGTPKEVYTGGRGWRMAVILNGEVVSDPSLKAALRNGGTISGHFTQREISNLASDLKAGSLSFTPKILQEKNISPELGKQERARGVASAIIGLVLVIMAMVSVYRFSGIIASLAVIFNILIIWGVLQNLDAALSLPGIAGIILTIGMAVDANVLVFERIREEFSVSGRIASAVNAGYRKAFSAILDSNVTTIVAALILIQFDSGPIKGFATTLIIGIASSMFTALFMTRYFFSRWVQDTKNKELKMRKLLSDTKIDFISKAKVVIPILVTIIAVGTSLLYSQRQTIFGMDFTGGYALTVEIQENEQITNYRSAVSEALHQAGLSSGEYHVRELNKPSHLRIQLATALELPGHAFHNMPAELEDDSYTFDYQKNPRIVWVAEALKDANLNISPKLLPSLDQDWTTMSGQLSDTMRNNALMGLGFALICILIYITFRFEFKYAISAIVCLGHDVLITLSIMAILHFLGVPMQIDLQVIGALMTIIGYSLNDTIIIFDRIREDSRVLRKLPFSELINHSVNITLSRTLMTSATTLLVLLALVTLGGTMIFDFAFLMTIGVIFGTISSLFVASPVMLYFHNREVAHQEAVHRKTMK